MSLLTANPRFILGAHKLTQCPEDEGWEVAFAGRSNVGKSSALNAITGRRSLARISKTPGRTQQINFFVLDEGERRLVDLPGYGYAKVSHAMRRHWDQTLERYLQSRQSLQGLVLIVDSRHPLKEFDQRMLAWCGQVQMPVHILLTKADKLSRSQAQVALLGLQKTLERDFPGACAQLFSAPKRQGVEEVSDRLEAWLAWDTG
ncbi:MAG: YihA family ribosome biogenesis GTP-binding protein [Gammaproteobacteria bacterium]|nr:YihA family ribosome biogenesis GTP-binding protein [Gammaproteobacteria bacterium]